MATRALVLGGGGPVGIAWESGLVAGLAEQGVLLGEADFILGTSAGSVVGALLAEGRPPAQLLESQRRGANEPPAAAGRTEQSAAAAPSTPAAPAAPFSMKFLQLMQRTMSDDADPVAVRRELGEFALQAATGSEEEFVRGFGRLGAAAGWPRKPYMCTAVDTADGSFVTWSADSGVELARAIASSCSVPGIFPPITINGRRYMDGGMRSATNADLATGYDRVLLVAVTAGDGNDPRAQLSRRRIENELRVLREGGAEVALVTPDDGSRTVFGLNLMDNRRRGPAAEEGLRQGRAEAARLQPFWG